MGKLRSSSVQGHSRTRPAWHRTKSWDLTTTAVKGSLRKTHLGSHKLLEIMWQCHLPAGAAGTFRMRQLLQKTIQRCEWKWGKKINAERNSKDLINLMAIKPQRFSLGKHQLCHWHSGQTAHQSPCQGQVLRSPLLARKLNSSPLGPAVWVVGTFFATKALTPTKRKYSMWKSYIKREK